MRSIAPPFSVLLLAVLMWLRASPARAATLAGTLTNSSPSVDLSAQGVLDWAHWGLEETNLFNRKLTIAPRISSFTLLDTNAARFITNSPAPIFTWTNGTPVSATNTSNQIAVTGTNSGFEVLVAADTTTKRLKLYFGLNAGIATVEASLSDSSAALFSTNITSTTPTNLACVFNYSAASTQQTLRVRVSLTSQLDTNALLLLGAATLARVSSNQPPVVNLISPTNEANVPVGDTLLEASAVDNDGTLARMEFFDGATKLGEVTNAPYTLLWTNAGTGTHTLTARVWDDEGTNRTSPATTIFVITNGGSLSPGFNTPTGTVNLTLEGAADWIHWGLLTENSVNRKAGVTPMLSTYSIVGSGPAYSFFDNFNGYTWTDGTPRAGITNTKTGVYIFGLGNGFEIQVPATNAFRTLRVHVGAFAGRGKLRAFLSDYSAPVFNDISVNNPGNGPGGIYTINYNAAKPGQKLIVRYTLASRYASDGNVTLQAASLLSDNNPPIVALLSPTNGTVVRVGTNVTLLAEATDGDGTISRVEFYRNNVLMAVSSNAPYTFTVTNIAAGNHTFTTRAIDNGGAFSKSPPALLHAITGTGFMRGAMTNAPATVNLSSEGVLDWVHWGFQSKNSVNRNAGVLPMVGNLDLIGSDPSVRYTDNFSAFSWTNGTPNSIASATRTGLYVAGVSNGFQITVAADRRLKRLNIYAGLYGARGRLEASLSDNSAAPYINNSLVRNFASGYALYSVDFSAGSTNQTLIVRYFAEELNDTTFGNVTWQAVTLMSLAPAIIPHQPPRNGAMFSGEFRSAPGVSYTIESTEVISPPAWQPFTNLMGGTSNAVFSDPNPAPMKFYRLRIN